MRKPGKKTLGSILIGIVCALCKLAARVVKKYPTHSVSVLLHLLLLGALASVFSLPRGAVYHRVFLPAPDHFTAGSEPDELSPPDPALDDDSADADDDAQRAMERLNQAAGSSGSSGAAAPNLIVAQGANALFLMPSGAGTDLQGTGAGGGGGGGKGLAKIRKNAGKLFGLDVGSSNEGLIVFLDKSGSMEKVAAQVQQLVERDFPDAKVFKLRGALFGSAKSLEKLKTVKKADPYILSYYQSMLPGSVIPKCTEYLQTAKVNPESVYMLSDFADYIDFAALTEFGGLLKARKIKFFAHSLDKSPPYAITRMCQETGGAVLVLPADKLPQPAHEK